MSFVRISSEILGMKKNDNPFMFYLTHPDISKSLAFQTEEDRDFFYNLQIERGGGHTKWFKQSPKERLSK